MRHFLRKLFCRQSPKMSVLRPLIFPNVFDSFLFLPTRFSRLFDIFPTFADVSRLLPTFPDFLARIEGWHPILVNFFADSPIFLTFADSLTGVADFCRLLPTLYIGLTPLLPTFADPPVSTDSRLSPANLVVNGDLFGLTPICRHLPRKTCSSCGSHHNDIMTMHRQCTLVWIVFPKTFHGIWMECS